MASMVENTAKNKENSSQAKGAQGFPTSNQVERLINLARAGEVEELGNLLEIYFSYLTVLATSELDQRLRKRVSPSDLVQETMLAAHRDFKDFRGNSPQELMGWLRQILINVLHGAIAKHVKARKRDIRREVSIDQVVTSVDRSAANLAAMLPGQVDSPSSPARAEERGAELAEHLAKLREDYREVIVLRNLQGLAFEDIAQRMDRSCGAVRMLWLRAMSKLQNSYGAPQS